MSEYYTDSNENLLGSIGAAGLLMCFVGATNGTPGWILVVLLIVGVLFILAGIAWALFKKLTVAMAYFNMAWRWDRKDK